MSMKKSSDTIGNRTRNLPVCSAVPQPLRHRVPPNICEGWMKSNTFTFKSLKISQHWTATYSGTPCSFFVSIPVGSEKLLMRDTQLCTEHFSARLKARCGGWGYECRRHRIATVDNSPPLAGCSTEGDTDPGCKPEIVEFFRDGFTKLVCRWRSAYRFLWLCELVKLLIYFLPYLHNSVLTFFLPYLDTSSFPSYFFLTSFLTYFFLTSFLTYLFPYFVPPLLMYLLTSLHTYLLTYLLTYLPTYYLLSYLPT
jgi:hypothetical protein